MPAAVVPVRRWRNEGGLKQSGNTYLTDNYFYDFYNGNISLGYVLWVFLIFVALFYLFHLWKGKPGQARTHQAFPGLCFACTACCWLFKVFLTFPCNPRALRDLHMKGRACSRRLALYQMTERSVFMHMFGLATVCVFTSYHAPLPLTLTSLDSALIPPHLSFYPPFPLGMWLTLHCSSVYTTQVTSSAPGSVCLSWFFREWGKTKGSPEAVSQAQKPAEKKVNMDYCAAWELERERAGSKYKNNTHGTWYEMNRWRKAHLKKQTHFLDLFLLQTVTDNNQFHLSWNQMVTREEKLK